MGYAENACTIRNFVDIVNLGLIYDVTVIELENGLHHVAVKMTLTAPAWDPIW